MLEDKEVFVIYSNKTNKTGKKIAEVINADDHGKELERRVDILVRWGSSKGVRYIPNIGTINNKSAIQKVVNKFKMLKEMDEHGVNTPPYSREIENIKPPAIGRNTNHTQGNDINLILQKKDTLKKNSDYYIRYIPKAAEYRVHVFDNKIIKINKKKLSTDTDKEEYNPVCWNYETGWNFGLPDNKEKIDITQALMAVQSLDLNFGAVDMIKGEEDEKCYVLEVNTAPSLDDKNLTLYKKGIEWKMKKMIGDTPSYEFDFIEDEEDGGNEE